MNICDQSHGPPLTYSLMAKLRFKYLQKTETMLKMIYDFVFGLSCRRLSMNICEHSHGQQREVFFDCELT